MFNHCSTRHGKWQHHFFFTDFCKVLFRNNFRIKSCFLITKILKLLRIICFNHTTVETNLTADVVHGSSRTQSSRAAVLCFLI